MVLRGKFEPMPSRGRTVGVTVATGADGLPDGTVVGYGVGVSGEVARDLGIGRDGLAAVGFTGKVGEALVLPRADGAPVVAVGLGAATGPDELRDAAAAFALAAKRHGSLALVPGELSGVTGEAAAQAVVEGVLLARYDYPPLKSAPVGVPVENVIVVVAGDGAAEGGRRGVAFAAATMLSRDLANSPPSMLSAEAMADCATAIAGEVGLEVEVFDRAALIELGCGGLLGVNAGSVEEPRMIKLRYRPAEAATGRLALVGKGIMYDSGGISLKPSDLVHAQMKNDMSGAGAILAAMSQLAALGCRTEVTGYLMCTDNMPSATATKLGDVLIMRGGKTVEVLNTDAEGRLVMADALVLATEEPVDAIVDIATLTGACLRTLGPEVAGLFANDTGLAEQVTTAAQATAEPVWQLPLDKRYRSQLDSGVADMTNMGGVNAGSITAALFLAEFVGETPWAHLDIAGTAQNDIAASWRPKGCTGFGARLLLELALNFTAPKGGVR
ncbi:leucyl aminopeptidase [Allocatelliglobosispora scoriae]|uniref:Probable cytosol aminopeptidase n=1 Tax=Allocatelliglobosispora scoriae TaxID=643052 RepID=A0A841BPU3_9ACTN|nr:leucyl aminopeptidase [Allocatelliglobosispora scoriae]MBB5868963.1 leucyl aminopeptidase [Allocatelliglobosispora scoriae]